MRYAGIIFLISFRHRAAAIMTEKVANKHEIITQGTIQNFLKGVDVGVLGLDPVLFQSCNFRLI